MRRIGGALLLVQLLFFLNMNIQLVVSVLRIPSACKTPTPLQFNKMNRCLAVMTSDCVQPEVIDLLLSRRILKIIPRLVLAGDLGYHILETQLNDLRLNVLRVTSSINCSSPLAPLSWKYKYENNIMFVRSHSQSKDACHGEITTEQQHLKQLRVGVIHYPPFILFPEDIIKSSHDIVLNKVQLNQLDGVEYRILKYFTAKFNISMEITLRQESDLWGIVYMNGSATGLVGMVRDGMIDIAAGGFNWDLRYWSNVELTHPHRKTLVKFLTPRRGPASNWLSLVQPFKLDTWWGIAAVIVASALTMYAAQWIEQGARDADLPLNILVSLGVLTQQGDMPKRWMHGVRRPMLLGLQIATLLLGACYSGLLVAVLTLESPAQQIDTIEQLARSQLRYTDVDEIFPGQLKLSEDPFIIEILSRLSVSRSWHELTNRLQGEHFAYSVECLDTGFLCLQERFETSLLQRMHLTRDFALTSETAFIMTKGFPLRRVFDEELLRLTQSGILNIWEREMIAVAPERDMALAQRRQEAQQQSGPIPLSRSHLGGPFIFFGFGLSLAFASFTCEILYGLNKF